MKKQRILAPILAAAFTVTILSGCGSQDQAGSAQSESVLDNETDTGSSSQEQQNSSKTSSDQKKKSQKNKNSKKTDSSKDTSGSSNNKKKDSAQSSEKSSDASSENSQTNGSSRNSSKNQKSSADQQKKKEQKTSKKKYSCTIYISAARLLKSDSVSDAVKSIVPADGVILSKRKVTLKSGDTVKSVLNRVAKEQNITITTKGSDYVSGIAGISEFDGGDLSGWMYSVNGIFPQKSYNQYKLKNGDDIAWRYTLNMGEDLK